MQSVSAYLLQQPVDLVAHASASHASLACLAVRDALPELLHGPPLHDFDVFAPPQLARGLGHLLVLLPLEHVRVGPEQLLPVHLPHSLGGRAHRLRVGPVYHLPACLVQLCLRVLKSLIDL